MNLIEEYFQDLPSGTGVAVTFSGKVAGEAPFKYLLKESGNQKISVIGMSKFEVLSYPRPKLSDGDVVVNNGGLYFEYSHPLDRFYSFGSERDFTWEEVGRIAKVLPENGKPISDE